MQKLKCLALSCLFSAAFATLPAYAAAPKIDSWTSTVQQAQHQSGLFDLYWNAEKNQLHIAVGPSTGPLLLGASLAQGLGSNDVGLDRASVREFRLVEFRRYGNKVLLIQPNQRFTADSESAAERQTVAEGFADSVLWAGEIIATTGNGDQQRWLLDFSSFVLSDQFGIATQIQQTDGNAYQIDALRSVVLGEELKSHPENIELEALLTFTGKGDGKFVGDVAMTNSALTMRQHLSFIKAPDAGFKPRAYHPYSGGFVHHRMDFAQPLDSALLQPLQVRFRLEKINPGPAPSKVKKPIVFYLDPGTPEPVRSALLDGANWWKTAFEKAGFIDAFRTEVLPEGVDPTDSRYNFIAWTHRATRGWSYGAYLHDPRTGEIIRGVVNLGSQRVRHDILIAEGLLAPYGKANEAELKNEAQQMALARLRQLSAHEVGHALGLNHNFAASVQGNGSVMDYPHPQVRLDEHGHIRLDTAYDVGVGAWDEYIVKHAYGVFENEQQDLLALRREARAAGLQYMADADVRFIGAAHPHGNLWDFGGDTLQTYDQLMRIRSIALNNFGRHALPPTHSTGELQTRLVPIYLLHRYQLEAVARLIGGVSYAYLNANETEARLQPVAGDQQRLALQRLLRALSPETLTLPDSLRAQLLPIAEGYNRSREAFDTRTTPMFDPISAAEATAAYTFDLLLAPERLNRVAEYQHGKDALALNTVFEQLYDAVWEKPSRGESELAPAIDRTIKLTSIHKLITTYQSAKLHETVKAELWQQLKAWQKAIASERRRSATHEYAASILESFFAAPAEFKSRADYRLPPGSPI